MKDIKELKKLAIDKTILYVEDNPDLRKSFAAYLQKFFKKVTLAEDGEQGLEKYESNTFDIVITDISMPKKDGFAMLKEIKERNPEQETMVLSGHTDMNFFLDAIRIGIDGYILKPMEIDQFNKELLKVLSKVETINELKTHHDSLERLVQEKVEHERTMIVDKIENHQMTLLSLVDLIEKRDSYTAGHSLRVANYCKIIAQSLGHSSQECDLVYEAGILHDIGKIGIPDSVLLKPGQFKETEYELIKQHVDVATNVLKNIPMYKNLVDIIGCHHERYDGSGYPNGFKEDEIPDLARIMIVADAFDAMTTNRIYKRKKSISEAMQELKRLCRIQFHPEVVDVLADTLGLVELDNSIYQLPQNEMDQGRFAYFYKDQVTEAYNQTYLETVLIQGQRENTSRYLYSIDMHNLDSYNRKHGWSKGDVILSQVSNYLQGYFDSCELFRVHGDRFVLISDNEIDTKKQKLESIDFLKEHDISMNMKLFFSGVMNEKDIENLDNKIYV